MEGFADPVRVIIGSLVEHTPLTNNFSPFVCLVMVVGLGTILILIFRCFKPSTATDGRKQKSNFPKATGSRRSKASSTVSKEEIDWFYEFYDSDTPYEPPPPRGHRRRVAKTLPPNTHPTRTSNQSSTENDTGINDTNKRILSIESDSPGNDHLLRDSGSPPSHQSLCLPSSPPSLDLSPPTLPDLPLEEWDLTIVSNPGDVWLEVGSGAAAREFLVASSHLSSMSPVLRAMLNGIFKEAQLLRLSQRHWPIPIIQLPADDGQLRGRSIRGLLISPSSTW